MAPQYLVTVSVRVRGDSDQREIFFVSFLGLGVGLGQKASQNILVTRSMEMQAQLPVCGLWQCFSIFFMLYLANLFKKGDLLILKSNIYIPGC